VAVAVSVMHKSLHIESLQRICRPTSRKREPAFLTERGRAVFLIYALTPVLHGLPRIGSRFILAGYLKPNEAVRGMPLGLPPLSAQAVQLVEASVAERQSVLAGAWRHAF
jgi:hypothetical protein